MSDKHFKIPLITKCYVGEYAGINCVAFHQNGEILATSSDDGALKFWLLSDLLSRANGRFHTHRELVWKINPSTKINEAFFLPVQLYYPNPVRTIQGKSPIRTFEFHRKFPLMATHSTIATNCRIDKTCVDLWQVGNFDTLKADIFPRVAEVCSKYFQTFAFHPTEPLLVTCSGGDMKLWKLSSYTSYTSKLKKLVRWGISEPWERGWKDPMLGPDDWSTTCVMTQSTQHDTAIISVTFHPTAPIFATTGNDGTTRVWIVSSENSPAICLATLVGHRGGVFCAAFHPTEPLIATGGEDATVKLWRLTRTNPPATCVATLGVGGGTIYSVAFHPMAPVLATTCGTGATVWLLSPDSSSAICVADLSGHHQRTKSVAFHPSGNILCTAGRDGCAMLWDCTVFAKVQRKMALTRGGIEDLLLSRLFSGTRRRMPYNMKYQENLLRHKLTQRGPYLLKNVETPARRATSTARRLKSQQRAKSASPDRARPATPASSLRGRSASPKPHSNSGGSSTTRRRVKHYASNTKRYRRNMY